MGVYLVPPIGAGVWVEFEQGDPTIRSGSAAAGATAADIPTLAHAGLPVSPSIVLQTAAPEHASSSATSPGPPAASCCASGGSTLTINETGISLIAPKVEITAATIDLTGIDRRQHGALRH